MTKRLTKERLELLRDYNRLSDNQCINPMIEELLSEIDALRAENSFLKTQNEGYKQGYDAFKARCFRLEARIEKLRGALEETREDLATSGVPDCIREALSQDDKED